MQFSKLFFANKKKLFSISYYYYILLLRIELHMSSNVSMADRPPKFHLKKSFHSGFKDADLDKAIK
jgi:hypothetical protein